MLAGALAQSSNYLETEMYFLPTTYVLPLEQSTFEEFFLQPKYFFSRL